MEKISNQKYRSEIDGLRALAVIGVILNHFNFPILSSGYLGVDIFFVISGYVITSSLTSKKQSKDFKEFIFNFYSRRIKRLIPALIFYVLVISIFVCIFVPEKEVILRTGISSLFGLSNFYLLKQSTDYFAQTTELNPFTNTWSLGVEEQFYFLFPIIFWVSGLGKKLKNGFKNFTLISITLSIFSILIFIWLYNSNLQIAYFLMPTRFWELSAGVLIFIAERKIGENKNIFSNISSITFFILLIGIMFLPEEMGLIGTLMIVITTIFFLLTIKKDDNTYKFLTNKVSLFIGSISYSLYLWHWGGLSISKWMGINNSLKNNLILLIIIFIISSISYFHIENKFRYSNASISRTFLLGISSVIFSSFLIIFPIKRIFKYVSPNYIEKNKNQTNSYLQNNTCFKSGEPLFYWNECINSDKDSDSIILLTGDSMSRSLKPLANEFYKKDKFDLISFTQSGTLSPAIPFVPRKQNRNEVAKKINAQNTYLEEVITYVSEKKYKNKYIWIFNDMNFYFYGREWQNKEIIFLDEYKKRLDPKVAFNNWINSLENLIKKANKKEIKILYFGTLPSIELGYEVVCVKKSQTRLNDYIDDNCKDNVIRRRSSIQGKYLNENFENRIKNLGDVYPNFFYFDTSKTLCEDLKDCEVYEKGFPYIPDGIHLSPRKAKDLYPLIKSITNNAK